MNTLQLRHHPLALSRWDRILLFGAGAIRFRPNSFPAPLAGRRRERKKSCAYGAIRKAAFEFVDGKHGLSLPQFASRTGLSYDSLRAAIWKIRDDREKESAA